MTDQTTPDSSGAQPVADANSIDSIIDNAVAESNKPTNEAPKEQSTETEDHQTDEPWPRKAENALAKAKGKAAQLRAERDQERSARQILEQKLAQLNNPTSKQSAKGDGEPKETDFTNYHDYIRALQKYDLQQELVKLQTTQKETQETVQEAAWVAERENVSAAKAKELVKELPDLPDFVEEYGDIYDGFPEKLKRVFLESDNPLLAAYNLAKEGKFEALASMSLAKAAMEIGRAQTQAPTKPKTKAPAPLPASRGSVASGKKPDDMDGREIRAWMRAE